MGQIFLWPKFGQTKLKLKFAQQWPMVNPLCVTNMLHYCIQFSVIKWVYFELFPPSHLMNLDSFETNSHPINYPWPPNWPPSSTIHTLQNALKAPLKTFKQFFSHSPLKSRNYSSLSDFLVQGMWVSIHGIPSSTELLQISQFSSKFHNFHPNSSIYFMSLLNFYPIFSIMI